MPVHLYHYVSSRKPEGDTGGHAADYAGDFPVGGRQVYRVRQRQEKVNIVCIKMTGPCWRISGHQIVEPVVN